MVAEEGGLELDNGGLHSRRQLDFSPDNNRLFPPASEQAGRQVQRTALSGLNPTAMVWPRWTADEERRVWRWWPLARCNRSSLVNGEQLTRCELADAYGGQERH